MTPPDPTSQRKEFSEQNLRNAGIDILLLNIPISVALQNIDSSRDDTFNGEKVQACAKESWKTSPRNLKRAKLILATRKLPNASNYSREILGVFEYSDVERDNQPDKKGYYRSHFVGLRPASPEWIAKFKDGLIVGLNPRATNPLRYFMNTPKR
ncbi:MAG: hypothetical protein K2M31_00200 [Muribaculaceae bacterium]|nr:hypothetical protein [Muribaculaceae bacterium]